MIRDNSKKKYYPLSEAQKRFWRIYQANKGLGPDNLAVIFKINGRLNTALWLKAARRTFDRYEILRTNFIRIKGQPFQIISPDSKIRLKNLAAKAISPKGIEKIIKKTTGKIFHLEYGCLGEMTLIKLRSRQFLLVVSVQPIIADRWSLVLIMDEIFHSYKNLIEDRPVDSGPAIQYKDFVAWEKISKSKSSSARLEKYWREFFSEPIPAIDLKKISLEPAYRGKPGATLQQFNFDRELTQKIKTLCQKHRISLFNFLFAVFYLFLGKISRENNLVVSTWGTRRPRPDLAAAIGCFTDVIAAKVDLKKNHNLFELLATVQKNLAASLLISGPPPAYFKKNSLKSDASLFKNILFYLCSDQEKNQFAIAGLKIKAEPAYAERAYLDEFNLKIQAVEAGNQIFFNFRHNNLFSRASIENWFTGFKSCVDFFLSQPMAGIDNFLRQ